LCVERDLPPFGNRWSQAYRELVRAFISTIIAMIGAGCGGRESGTPAASCNDNGTVHASGTSWPCSDDCNTCSCSDGAITSALLRCLPRGSDGGMIDEAGEESGADSGADANCVVSASSYDQSCTVDTDCQEVTSTNYCATDCLCGGSAINVAAVASFSADVAKTPLGSGLLHDVGCPCEGSLGPCCRAGQCVVTCFAPSDTLPDCADAGGACLPSARATCGATGPPDGCAYSDEVCCLN